MKKKKETKRRIRCYKKSQGVFVGLAGKCEYVYPIDGHNPR